MNLRPSTRRIAAVLAGATVLAAAMTTGAAASPRHLALRAASPRSAVKLASAARARAAALGIHGRLAYAVDTPACAAPARPGYATCFAVRRTAASRSTAGAYAYVPAATHGPAGGYTPGDLAGAYGYNAAAKVHQTIGIVDWFDDPHALADLNHFDKHYGLPKETSKSFRKVNQKGKSAPLPKPDKDSSVEITLDIQSARAVCHHCRIILIEAKNASNSDLGKAENEVVKLGATEVSNSFGLPEYPKLSKSAINAYNHPGVVITASTGDNGWYGWDFANNNGGQSQGAASFPADLATVVAVGGTEIAISHDERAGEVVWNENGPEDVAGKGAQGATGSGCSTIFAAAPWQSAFAGYGAAECDGGRLESDVSAIADPNTGFDIYQTYGGKGWETVGGTSLASPVTAAMWALAGGAKGAAYPSSALYLNATLHPSSVFDVVPFDPTEIASGNSFCGGVDPNTCESDFGSNPNGAGFGPVDCSLPIDGSTPTSPVAVSTACNTVTGLDGPTGLGTPNSLRLFKATTPTLSLSGPSKIRKGHKASFRAAAKEIIPDATIEGYEIGWGDGSKYTKTTSGKATHKYTKAGTFTVVVVVFDDHNQETIKRYQVQVAR